MRGHVLGDWYEFRLSRFRHFVSGFSSKVVVLIPQRSGSSPMQYYFTMMQRSLNILTIITPEQLQCTAVERGLPIFIVLQFVTHVTT